jgi:hypothetical protein
MSDAAPPSSAANDNRPTYDYKDLAFYIKWAREAGTPDHALMGLPRLAFLPPAQRSALIDRAKADPAYQRARRSPVAVPILCFFVGLPLSIILTMRAAGVPIDRWAIDRGLGPGTYDRGVRIIDKRGNLTDGRVLNGPAWDLRARARGVVFCGSAVAYAAAYYMIFGDRKDKGPSANGYRLDLLLRKRPTPPPPPPD